MITSFDTAVVGGGLAGISAAITLAKKGIRVLLIEAKTYPHQKVCGEFLSPACACFLDHLDVLHAVQAMRPAYISKVTLTTPKGVSWNNDFAGMGIGISRYTLDQLLVSHAQAAGVHVLQGTTVSRIEGNLREGFTLAARRHGKVDLFRSQTVIAAYGKRSRLDRSLNRSFWSRNHPFVALKSHFYGPPLPQRVEVHTFDGGYCGLSEVEARRTNVCLLVKQHVFERMAANNISVFIRWMRSQNTFLDWWLSQGEQAEQQWHSISQIAFARKSLVEGDVLMAGDAAGLIAPLAGDGMEMALHGGQMAAHAVNHFLEGRWSASAMKQHYSTEWHQTFKLRLRLAQWLQTVILNPPLATVGLHLLNHLPALGDFIVNHTRDTRLAVNSGD